MIIELNEQFIIKGDSNNYIVEEFGEITSKNKETEKVEKRVGVVKTTYHPSIQFALRHIIRQAPKDESIKNLEDIVKSINSLEKSIENIKIQENPKKDYKGIKAVLKQINQYCDEYNCNESCPMWLHCESENWDLLKEDLKDLGINEEECGMQ